ncbi:hypothetical protein VIBHAR_06124 [Vibrio campbellii ATCC BAA-1116]|uniref:Uncharacterized protein n=1 Tax=Vibrio campbellii (strain ATCC BAA-1116) TaxID=2902295 RepID=A7N759_VIBC1|nr:hypothetical protein VIBHAR_06124 [Vibrio campbellii ATCC BAA-1116]
MITRLIHKNILTRHLIPPDISRTKNHHPKPILTILEHCLIVTMKVAEVG